MHIFLRSCYFSSSGEFERLHETRCVIWYHLYNWEKCGKHPWKSLTFSKVSSYKACNFTRSSTPPWVIFTVFLNCTHGTKSRNASHIYKKVFLSKTGEASKKSEVSTCMQSTQSTNSNFTKFRKMLWKKLAMDPF